MFAEIVGAVIFVIVMVIFAFQNFITRNGAKKQYYSGSFMDINSLINVDAVINDIVIGNIDYRNVKNELVQNTYEEIRCGNSEDMSKKIQWDPINNLHKTCVYNKRSFGIDPHYQFTYKLRDLLTTIYVRSFEEKTQKQKQNTRFFSLQLTNMFNIGMNKFITIYNQQTGTNYTLNDVNIIYKGGNVIAMHTRMFIKKLLLAVKEPNPIIKTFLREKILTLKRGDWDFTLNISHELIGSPFENAARTFILYILQGIKKFIDDNDIFQMKNIANMIQRDLIRSQDVADMINEYKRAIDKSVTVESVTSPGYVITSNSIQASPAAIIPSKFSFKRNHFPNITDTFQVNSFIDRAFHPMVLSGVSIGYTEQIKSSKTYITSSFDLARVKINNKTMIKVDGKMVEKNLSADIIDLSFTNADDTSSQYISQSVKTIGCKKWVVRQVGGYTIPYLTPHYLFYDLCKILVEESTYPWDDKKYGKRLDRLITMGILSAMIVQPSANEMKKCLVALLKFLNSINSNLDLNLNLLSDTKIINDKFVINFKHNHFTYKIITTIYKIIIYHKFLNDIATDVEIEFVRLSLKFIFEKTSDFISYDAFLSSKVDAAKFSTYVEHVKKEIKGYLNVFENLSHDVIINDTDTITIDEI